MRYPAYIAILVYVALSVGCSSNPSGGKSESRDERGPEAGVSREGGAEFVPLLDEDDDECEPRTCDQLGHECGVVADGCGEVITCGGCGSEALCGIVERNACTPLESLCDPLAKSVACEDKDCGLSGDGCGGTYDCGGCDDGETCGLYESFICGAPFGDDDCPARIQSCEDAEIECGYASNGCGGVLDCEEDLGGCEDGQVCGFAGPGQCGDVASCEPRSMAAACEGKECGLVGDGCIGSFDCGECSGGEVCGAKEPFQCEDVGDECIPFNAAVACEDKQCGLVLDGCGSGADHLIDCGSVNGGCEDDEWCGLVEAFQCDPLPDSDCATAESCEELGWECGLAVDECGSVFDCADEERACQAGRESCIGGVVGPALCLSGVDVDPTGTCPLCPAVPECESGRVTTLTGRVITPGRADDDAANQVGLANAFVFILQSNDADELPTIQTGIPAGGTACDRCDDQQLGPVLASARTSATGEYSLRGNIPVGEEFVLVVKVGKWRRAERFTVPASGACASTAVPHVVTRLPRHRSDGLGVNIPKTAITTGQADAMECVLAKLGVAPSEFGNPGGAADAPERIHLYRGGNVGNPSGARIDGDTPYDQLLYGDANLLSSYDTVIADCEGTARDGALLQRSTSGLNIIDYVNRGGRLFASHYSYSWVFENGDLPYAPETAAQTGLTAAAVWRPTDNSTPATGTGFVSVGRPGANPSKAQDFADWLVNEGAATAAHEIDIIEPRDIAESVGEFSEEFIYRDIASNATSVQQFAFNTPYASPEDEACGRVGYSAFHVSASGVDVAAFSNVIFPDHCDGTTGLSADLTDQEKVLLYTLFDLGACIDAGDPEPPACNPIADCTGRCGQLPDGCGGVVRCTCAEGEACAPGGLCTDPGCEPVSCEDQHAECGQILDGCGAQLDCGECDEPELCGGGGRPNRCGLPGCPSHACEESDAECGWLADGCASGLDCGDCAEGQICIGNECVGCKPLSCAEVDAECGEIGDGCGGIVDCGDCPEGSACGVLEANQCSACKPLSCAAMDAECGEVGDGCGDAIDCGDCPDGEVCGIDDPFRCGPPPTCELLTCEELEAECGEVPDGCDDVLECGECPPGERCGLLVPNQCARLATAR
jgi:hypothetical protein